MSLALAYRDPFDASWRERVFVLVPIYGIALVALLIGLHISRKATLELVGLLPVSFFAAGKFLPLWAVSGKSHFGAYELGLVIWLLDTFTVLNIVYALEGLYKIAPIHRALMRVQRNAALVLRAYPRIRRAAVAGVVLFVLFPIAGTGAIGGTFVGILLGLHRATLIATVSVGGLIGGMAMAFLAVNFQGVVIALRDAQSDRALQWVLLGALVVAVAAGLWWLNRVYHRALADADESAP